MSFCLAEPDEALAECAPLARRLAPQLCRVDPASGQSCAVSHGLWPTLRRLGLATSPALHAEFFRAALGGLARHDRPLRLLVSGCADHAMLALALAALDAAAIPCAATVLDLCETPLRLNLWYAQRLGRRIETWRGDILAYAPAEPFDVICTHAFFGMFPPEARPALAARWRGLLRPGGAAITVNRLRPGAAGPAAFDAAQARAFAEAARERAAALSAVPADELEALAREARAYAARQTAYPVRSSAELRGLFEGAGFELARLDCGPIAPALRSGVAAPTVPGDADYAKLIAIRR